MHGCENTPMRCTILLWATKEWPMLVGVAKGGQEIEEEAATPMGWLAARGMRKAGQCLGGRGVAPQECRDPPNALGLVAAKGLVAKGWCHAPGHLEDHSTLGQAGLAGLGAWDPGLQVAWVLTQTLVEGHSPSMLW